MRFSHLLKQNNEELINSFSNVRFLRWNDYTFRYIDTCINFTQRFNQLSYNVITVRLTVKNISVIKE